MRSPIGRMPYCPDSSASRSVRVRGRIDAASDEDDNRFLECAFSAEANYLITGNLRHYPDICGITRIVNARRFLAECFDRELARLDRA